MGEKMKAKITVFDSFGHTNDLIKTAASTCYRSEHSTTKTAEDFVVMLKKFEHLAMLEFSWYVFRIYGSNLSILNKVFNNYIKITQEEYNVYVVSGNGRAFLDSFRLSLNHQDSLVNIISHFVYHEFKRYNSVFFELSEISIDNSIDAELMKDEIEFSVNFLDIEKTPPEHQWRMVKLSDVSRGLTHEIVRHRNMSFAQASTRYINFENFEILFELPQNIQDEELNQKIQKWFEDTKALYKSLIDKHIPKDICRQILPIGILGEICVAGRLEDWEHFFKLRCDPKAHSEIRNVAHYIKKEFTKLNLI